MACHRWECCLLVSPVFAVNFFSFTYSIACSRRCYCSLNTGSPSWKRTRHPHLRSCEGPLMYPPSQQSLESRRHLWEQKPEKISCVIALALWIFLSPTKMACLCLGSPRTERMRGGTSDNRRPFGFSDREGSRAGEVRSQTSST